MRYVIGRLYFSEVVADVAVYAATGALVAQFTGNHSEAPVNLSSGFYVIQAGGKSTKLLVNNGNGYATAQPVIVVRSAPVQLRVDEAIKIYWNIITGSASKSISIFDVDYFYFLSDNSVIYVLKNKDSMLLADYQGSELSFEPLEKPDEQIRANGRSGDATPNEVISLS